MFNTLTKLSYKRLTKEDIGFYLAYSIVFIVIGATQGVIVALITGKQGADLITLVNRTGMLINVMLCFVISLLIVKGKNSMGSILYLVLASASGLLSIFGGGIVGLIIATFLTTRESIISPAPANTGA
jgi:hypothetical protein